MKKKKTLMEKIIELEVLKAEDRGELRGREIGEARGEARGIVSLFKKGFVSLKNAAAELNMSPEEFTKLASTK